MNITQIEKNLSKLIKNLNEENFIYDLLLAYNLPKATVTRLQKGTANLSKLDGEVSLIHRFFGHTCLEIDVFDNNGIRHTPREWFIAPLKAIEQAVTLLDSGEIINYRYDKENEVIVKK
jgi:hypothetical protein